MSLGRVTSTSFFYFLPHFQLRFDPLVYERSPAEQSRIEALLINRFDIGTYGFSVRLCVHGPGGLTREMLAGGIGDAASPPGTDP